MADPLTTQMIISEPLVKLDDKFLGPVKHIYCYRDREGSVPALEFLKGLDNSVAATYATAFTAHCEGHVLRQERHRQWPPKKYRGCHDLYEYKDNRSKTRLMHTTEVGNIYVLLFGFAGKKENKVKNVHVLRAQRMRDEYRERAEEIRKRFRDRGSK